MSRCDHSVTKSAPEAQEAAPAWSLTWADAAIHKRWRWDLNSAQPRSRQSPAILLGALARLGRLPKPGSVALSSGQLPAFRDQLRDQGRGPAPRGEPAECRLLSLTAVTQSSELLDNLS